MGILQRLFGIWGVCGMLTIGVQAATALAEQSAVDGRGPSVTKRGKGAMYGPDQRLELMTRRLGLTKDQQARIKPILADEFAQMETLRGNDSYNRDERRAKLRQLNQETYDKIRPILTEQQQKRHEAVKQKIMDNRSKTRSTRPGPNTMENDPEKRLERLTRHLDLTPEQQARIKPILADEHAQLDALRGNDTYNKEERRARLLQLNKATSDRLMSVLTPEQQKIYGETRQKITERRQQTKDNPNRNPSGRKQPL